ncbi:Cytoplasm protein [Ceratobasidium theobromae]|uniref:Cytoplasm protein n=1 Tax=Ceratobasidium theobromae TaxID=1582974 RepID=A0A5N5QWC7_9AGAM|nr:Cytoplasm protein [Ceratobasidium theobromae]
MLPSYNAYNRRHPYHSLSRPTHAASSLRDRLLSRSRVTNLGLILIGCILGLSLLSNLRYILLLSESKLRAPTIPPLIADTVSYNSSESQLDHLIVVAGHAIWKGVSPLEYEKDSEWVLDVAQAGHGNPRAFYAHIAKGAQLALEDKYSLLVFSGGQTRKPTHLTEAQSYLSLALSTGLLPLSASSGPFERATTEDFALDSFQNLLFSVARFRERTGWYPRRITVVGFGVKKERFEKLHARAIRWPVRMFKYVGVDVDGQGDLEASRAGEFKNGFTPYTHDLYGCHDFLAAKRRSRNVGARFHPYHTSAPELTDLLDWCPPSRHQLFSGPLPWSPAH